jgi:GH15 family glucan-1,4-alpha-glucosidase
VKFRRNNSSPEQASTRPQVGVPMIDEHGLVGDLRTTALVASNGTVASMCLPDADSPSVFASLLDGEVGGHFAIELVDVPEGTEIRNSQNYLSDTNILITRLQAAGAITEIRDFMLPTHLAEGREGLLVRTITALHGPRTVKMTCWPGFDYARAPHEADLSNDSRSVSFHAGRAGGLALYCTHDLDICPRDRGPESASQVDLQAGESMSLVLRWLPAANDTTDGASEQAADVLALIPGWTTATEHFWHTWIDASTYTGRWSEPVRRSALCLKLLQHEPTGGIVAAPTFGLPEWPGAQRNWDYRYVWLRDAAFVVFAFLRIGLVDEAARFADWLSERCNEILDGSGLQPVYRLSGERPPIEEELGHLRGYADSQPVRVGNAAYDQVQLDVLGEVMDGLYLFDRVRAISWELWQALGKQLDWLADHWREPDSGMWEFRGPRQQFVSSKLLVWVAFERAGRLARRRGLPGDHDRWREEADAAYCWVQEQGWDDKVGAYVQRQGSDDLDASMLLIPMLRFAGGRDPRVLATLERVCGQLSTDSLLHRYLDGTDDAGGESVDGVGGPEATFTVCTFWYVENLARAGRTHDARIAFEKVLTYANEVGLFSEQIGPAGEALGNFPQALTHLALISAATTLDRMLLEE